MMEFNMPDRVIALSKGEELDYDRTKIWVDMFREQAREHPERTAVEAENGSLSYAELDRLSERLAAALIEREGVRPDEFVAVRMGRVKEFHVAVLAIHKAGAAYMPVDLDYPAGRVAYMMEDSGARLTLTERSVAALLKVDCPAVDLASRRGPDRRAYMIYTSGSTGKPKGVVIGHRALTNFVHFIAKRWGLGGHSRIALHSNFAFDAAVEDLFPALTVGGTVFVVPESARRDVFEMRDFIGKHHINGGSYSTQFGQLLAMDEPLDVDYLCMGGEAMTITPKARGPVYNVYGPTEFTVDATYYELEKGREYDNIPIGRPLDNCAAYIVNDKLELLPLGEVGELCMAGPQLADGYWNRPELTAEKFTTLKLSGDETVRIYRTGDLARWNDEGQLEYCGRIDTQVKLRGFRVELGEVESRAARFPGIRQTAAEVRRNTLCLYYTASEPVDEAALSAFMAEKLADYMVPGAFMRLETMPHNVNGKIDRKALPDPVICGSREYVAPETDAERDMVSAMAKVLGVAEPLGVTHDFFELGGDSIKAIRLVSALRNLGYAASVADVMKARTARALAAGLASSGAEAVSQAPFEGEVADTAIFAFFKDLDYPNPAYYNQSTLLTVHGRASLDALQRASDAIAVQHDMLRAVIRDGHLFVRPADEKIPIEEYTLGADETGAIRALCEEIQSHLDIEKALVRLALIHAGARDLFFLTAHHTIVDGVSWRIWMGDLETAYGQAIRGEAIRLPAKTHTYRDYAEAMKRYRSSYALSQEIPYWKGVEARMLGLDTSDNKDYARRFESLSVAMSEADTEAFRRTRLNARRLQVNDLLLTALGQAYRQAFGKDAVSVSMEGHGREELGRRLSIDRAIGWFTSIFPVVLEGFTGDTRTDLIRTKETLHAIPNKGVGYNILAFVEGAPETHFQTERAPMVIFNYLGDVSGEEEKGEFFEPDSVDGFSAGLDYFDPRNHDGSDLAINCLVEGGRFTLWLDYNAERFTEALARSFAEAILKNITTLSAFLNAQPGSLETTASDLGETEWSLEEFERISAEFAARGEALRRIYPLTPMQEGMLLEHVTHPQSHAYRLIDIYECTRPLDEALLRHAVDALASRHEVLRTAIIHRGVSRFRQAIVDRKLPLKIVDLTACADPFAEAQRIRLEFLDDGYDLQEKPLTQFVYGRTGQGGYLIFATHHIITDGWCFDTILRDLEALLAGKTLTGSDDGQYERAVREQLARDRNAAVGYFTKLLDGLEGGCELPCWGEVPEAERAADNQMHFTLSPEITGRLAELCREAGATPADGFNLVWALALATATRQDDVTFNTIVSGRDGYSLDVSDLVGLFINAVPVRVRLEKGVTARQLLKALHEQGCATKSYDYCALSDVQRAMDGDVKLGAITISYENYAEEARGEGLLRPALIREEHVPGFVGVDAVALPDGGVDIRLTFDESRYRAVEMERLAALVSNLEAQVVDRPDAPVALLPRLSQPDADAVIALSRGEDLAYDRGETWVDMFKRWAAQAPERTAVVDSRGYYTYGELDRASDAVAAWLLARGVGDDDFVAVKMGRVRAFVAAVLGVNKAGAAYVPVDPDYPEDRIAYMLEDSGAKVTLTEEELARAVAEFANAAPVNRATPERLAYMIYTSGSTGRPKGVMQSHRALRAFVAWGIALFGITPDSVHAEHASFSFDASLDDLIQPMTAGAQVHIISEELRQDLQGMAAYLRDHRVTCMSLSTQIGMALINQYPDVGLKTLMMGGEKMLPCARTSTQLINGYGPTEFTVSSSFHIVDQERDVNIPIGRPVPNTWSFICDGSGNLLPRGMAGELCLAGPQIAEGYWRRPELTAERFCDCRFMAGTKMYRTGDLARYDENGELCFLGRLDNQVKLRGFRIELGEVENCAALFEGVDQAAAEVRRDMLCLYYAASGTVEEEQLKAFMASRLTGYMVPEYFLRLEKMPMTPNGKINRRALPDPDVTAAKAPYLAPRSATEQKLCDAFAAALDLEPGAVGVNDDFFALGGNSLRSMRAMALADLDGLTAVDLMRLKTPAKLAAEYGGRKGSITPEDENRARGMTLPATTGQIGMVDYQFIHVNSVMYNLPTLYRFPASVDARRLLDAVNAAVRNHPALSTVLEMDDEGNLVQRWRPEQLEAVALEEVPEDRLEETLRGLIRPFRVIGGALFRGGLYRSGEWLYLFLDMHHIISDGFSVGVLLDDIALAYRGEALPQDNYYSWLLAEKQAVESKEYRKAEKYYRNLLGKRPWCNVPTPDYVSWEADLGSEGLDLGLTLGEVEACGNRLSTSGNALCVTAGILALQEYCHRENILLKWINNDRTDARFDHTMGLLFRELPVAVQTQRYETLEALISEVNRQIAAGFINGRSNYLEVGEDTLQDSMEINWLGALDMDDALSALGGEEIGLEAENAIAGERVGVYIEPWGDTLGATVEYQKKAYAEGSMARFLALFKKHLRNIVLGEETT